jgi:hypothetical protein
MGSEFAEPQKRPDPQKQQPYHAPKQQPGAKPQQDGVPPKPIDRHFDRMASAFGPDQDPNDGHKKLSWWTPEMAKTAVEPTRSAYRGGAKLVDTMTPEQREKYREALANDPALSWLLDPNGKRPTPFEVLQMKRKQKAAAAQSQQSEEPSPIADKPEPIQVASATLTSGMLAQPQPGDVPESLPAANPATGPVQLNAVAASILMANAIPFPTGGMPSPSLPNPFPLLKPLTPFVKGVGGIFGGFVLEGVLAAPANNEEVEWLRRRDEWNNQQRTPASSVPTGVTPTPSTPVQPSIPMAPMPVEPSYQVPNVPEQRSKEQQQFEQQQQQWKQEQQQREQEWQQQQAAFKTQQAAQTKLWAQQDKLDRLSVGFMLNEKYVASFEEQLTPSQKGALTKEVNERYKALTGLAQQAENQFEQYQVDDLKQKLRQQVLYERFVPVREIYHFGKEFLNGDYTPQKMKAVRGYFDQLFEGKYSKSIPADKQAAIIQSADAKYTEETGKKPNREDLLWKTYRNAEASEKFPDLWTQFRDDLSKASSQQMGIVKGQPLPPLGGFGEGPSIAPEALKPETFPSGGATLPPLGGFGEGTGIAPELLKPETFPSGGEKLPPLGGFGEGPQPDFDHVFMSRGDGLIPGTPEHRKARWEEYQDSGRTLDYENWSKRYDVAMQQARKANAAVDAYHENIGWGQREVTVDAGGVKRRLDIADRKKQRGIEYKTGYTSLKNPSITSEIERDAILVQEGWDIEWVFRDGASEPLLEELSKTGIKYKLQ